MTTQKVKVSKKAPKNDAALKSLKNQGYHVKIEHFRRDFDGEIIPDRDIRIVDGINDVIYEFEINLRGGATKMILVKDDNKIEIVSTCYWKDRFCRKHGVKACLEKLEKEYNIKA